MKQLDKNKLPVEVEKRFEWVFEDHRNKDSLAYMFPTIGDIKKLKQFLSEELALAKEEGAREEIEKAAKVIERLVDDDDCTFDHHGYCQTHYGDNPCRNKVGLEYLSQLTNPSVKEE